MSTPGQELAEAVAAEAKAQMAEHLRDAARYAGPFIDAYAFQLVHNRARKLDGMLTMHSAIRHMARELVRDEASMLRRANL